MLNYCSGNYVNAAPKCLHNTLLLLNPTADTAPSPHPTSPPTYEDYAQKVYPRSKLDCEVDDGTDKDNHLYKIADVLMQDWEIIAPWLKLTVTQIYDIRTSRRRPAIQRSDHRMSMKIRLSFWWR